MFTPLYDCVVKYEPLEDTLKLDPKIVDFDFNYQKMRAEIYTEVNQTWYNLYPQGNVFRFLQIIMIINVRNQTKQCTCAF